MYSHARRFKVYMVDDTPKKTKDDKKPEKASKAASSKGSKAGAQSKSDVVKFAGNIEIFSQQPLASYNVDSNKAYKAVSRGKSTDNLLAIVCERSYVPRRNAAAVYTAIINPGLLPVKAYGKVYWPPAKEERYIIVYKHILGERLLQSDAPKAMGMKQDDVMDLIVKPMVDILQDFRDKDFVHGSIRPSNMFKNVTGKGIVLGDCLSTQASATQPSLFEPVERALANPNSRGAGTLADDMYAFGVTLAVMLRSQDPLAGKSEEEVTREKIASGSYSAVTGKDRFKGSILELLRGLLHDDPTQRWTIDETLVWLDGRRLSPKQALKRNKAARPFSFCGEKYLQTANLAMALPSSPHELLKLVEDGSLEQWLARSLEDEQAVERLEEAYHSSVQFGRGSGFEERLVSNVSSVLDTMGPIRFRHLRMAGDGIGSALYEAIVTKQDMKVFADVFTKAIAMNWVTSTENPNLDVSGLISRFDSCKMFIQQNKIGFGLERCLYTLAPEAPCITPKLKDYFISTPEDLIYAFESLCQKGESPALFLDRHSAAFLSVKDSKLIDSYLFDLNAPEDYKNLMGNLKCLATIQKRSKLDEFPHIAKVFKKRLPVLYKRYHDKKVRDNIKDSIEKYVQSGDLVKMANLLDSPDLINKDFKGFRAAMVEYAHLRDESDKLERQLENESTFGRATGKEFAALISGALSVLIIVVTAFMFLSDKSIF